MLKRGVVLLFFLLALSSGASAVGEFAGGDQVFYHGNSTGQVGNVRNETSGAMGAGFFTAVQQTLWTAACDAPNRNQTVFLDNNAGAGGSGTVIVGVHSQNGTIGPSSTMMTVGGGSNRHMGIACGVEELSRRVVAVAINGSAAGTNRFRIWDGTAMSTDNLTAVDNDGPNRDLDIWITSRPGANEFAIWGTSNQNQTWNAIWNASANNFYDVANLTGINEGMRATADSSTGTSNRTSACAYESASGRLVCFYGNSSTTNGTMYYTIRNSTENGGGRIAGQLDVSTANLSTLIGTVNLIPNPVTDEMILIVFSGRNVSLFVWNTTSLTNAISVETAQNNQILQSYIVQDARYRYITDNSTTTEAVACWTDTAGNGVAQCRIWNGSTWSAENNAQDVATGDVENILMTANINGRSTQNVSQWMYMMTSDNDGDFNIQHFNSSTWGGLVELTANGFVVSRKNMEPLWIRWDTTIPVYTNAAQNATSIQNGTSIYLNASVRDNFQIDQAWLQTNETGSFVNYTSTAGRFTNYAIKGAAWKNFNATWTNNNITTNTTIGWMVCVNDTNGLSTCTGLQTFQINTSAAGGGPDPCAYSGSGNWNVALNDNCVLSSSAAVYPNNVTLTGTGSFTIASGGNLDANKIFYTPASLTGNNIFAVLLGGRFSYRP